MNDINNNHNTNIILKIKGIKQVILLFVKQIILIKDYYYYLYKLQYFNCACNYKLS